MEERDAETDDTEEAGGDDNTTGNEREQLEFGPSLTLLPHLSSSLPPSLHLSPSSTSTCLSLPGLLSYSPCVLSLPHTPSLSSLLHSSPPQHSSPNTPSANLLPIWLPFFFLVPPPLLCHTTTKQQLRTSSSSVSVHCGAWSTCWPTHAHASVALVKRLTPAAPRRSQVPICRRHQTSVAGPGRAARGGRWHLAHLALVAAPGAALGTFPHGQVAGTLPSRRRTASGSPRGSRHPGP